MYTCAWRHVYDTSDNQHTHTLTSHTHDRAGTYMYMRAATLGRGGREPQHAINVSLYVYARGDI